MYNILIGLLFAGLTCSWQTQNFEANFNPYPTLFEIDVSPVFESSLKQRARSTRYVSDDLGVAAFVDGPSVANATSIGEYWSQTYDWFANQKDINDRLTQYTTTVHTPHSNYTEPIPLHFVHHRSKRADAIPLLFIHGFPGSFLEVGRIISNLTNPSNASLPAFHVVAPSIPGFGFSPAPVGPGFGPLEAGHAFDTLMLQLNYTRYVIQGGDLGGAILRYQASSHPDSVVSILSNFWIQPPNKEDTMRHLHNQTTAEENAWFEVLNTFATTEATHFYTQQTTPLQAAFAMTDSPIGFTMWIYQILGKNSPGYVWTLEEIITWSMMYLIQGPYGAMRFYKETNCDGAFVGGTGFGELPYVHVPVGLTNTKYDLGFNVPLEWAKRTGNVTVSYQHDTGGHFVAYQTPELLLNDIWRFFGNTSISGTAEFKRRAK